MLNPLPSVLWREKIAKLRTDLITIHFKWRFWQVWCMHPVENQKKKSLFFCLQINFGFHSFYVIGENFCDMEWRILVMIAAPIKSIPKLILLVYPISNFT